MVMVVVPAANNTHTPATIIVCAFVQIISFNAPARIIQGEWTNDAPKMEICPALICLGVTGLSISTHYFIKPDFPVVMARMQPALFVLQEYKSMDVTSEAGFGFDSAVRLKRRFVIFPFAE